MVSDHNPTRTRRTALKTIGAVGIGTLAAGSGVVADDASTEQDGPRRSSRDSVDDWNSAHTAELVTVGDVKAQRCDPDPDRNRWRNTIEIVSWVTSWDEYVDGTTEENKAINRGMLDITVSGTDIGTNMNLDGDFIGGYESEGTISEGPSDVEEAILSAAESVVTSPLSTTASAVYSAITGYISNDSNITNHEFDLRWHWEEDGSQLPYEAVRWAQVDVYLEPGDSATIAVEDETRIDPGRSGWMYADNSFEFDVTAPTTDCDDLQ